MCLSCAQDISLGFGPRHLISSVNEKFSALTYLPKDVIVSSLLRRQTGFEPFKEFAYLSGGSKKYCQATQAKELSSDACTFQLDAKKIRNYSTRVLGITFTTNADTPCLTGPFTIYSLKIRRSVNFLFSRNLARLILKLQNCERVGRGIIVIQLDYMHTMRGEK